MAGIERRDFLKAGAGALAGVVLFGACGSDDDGGNASATTTPSGQSGGSDVQALHDKAKAEGTMLWYTPLTGAPNTRIVEGFKKKFPGVNVEIVALISSQLAPRFNAELDAGSATADVLISGDPVFVADAVKAGKFVRLSEAGIPDFDKYPKKYAPDEVGSAFFVMQQGVFVYNTRQVPEADAPKKWEDLLDPKWKDKLICADPRVSPTFAGFWAPLARKLGNDFITKLVKDQKMLVLPGGATAQATQSVGAGEKSILAMGSGLTYASSKATGAPIGLVIPPVTSATPIVPGLNAKAAHPNAARLFLHYLLTEEGATVAAGPVDEGIITPFKAVAENRDVLLPTLADYANPKAVHQIFGLA